RSEKVHRNDLVLMFIGGLMGFLGTQFLFSLSLEYTSPVVFSLIMALTPAVVLLLSAMFLKEAIPARKIGGIILGISGAALIILLGKSNSENGAHGALGILFAFLCVLCYSGYLVLTRRISVKYQPVTVAKWMFLVSAVAVFPFSTTVLNEQAMFTESTALLPYVLLAFALLFSTTLAFFLMPFALKRLEASVVSIFMNLQPIIASVVAMVVGQDSLTWDKPLAAILVLAGVYFVSTERLSKRKPVVLNA
ncbi:MAG: DMT family transporter, partial [Saprospiraceae bacterium]|nr:DMT family transporter [Saprospiraceae bacterium]